MAGHDVEQRQRHVFALGVLLVLATVVTTLAAFAVPPADEWLYVHLREVDLPSSLGWLADLRSVPVLVAVAIPLLLARRCRVAVPATAGAVAAGVGIGLGLQALVARPRPYDSALAGTDSYPSVMLLLLAVLVTTYPLWRGLAGHPHGWRLLTWAIGALVVASGVQEVYAGLRWPFDAAGALVIGAGLGIVVRVAVETPSLHRRCGRCPWRGGEPPPERSPAPAVTEPLGTAHPLYGIALVWVLAVAAAFGLLAYTRGVPRIPESGVMGTGLEVPLNLGLLVLMVVGVLVAARWHVAGAILVAVAAALLGYASSVHYEPWVAILVAVVAFVPALLLWMQWHRIASVRAALAVATATSLLLGATVYVAADNYTYYWGPTHPTSPTLPIDDDVVEWMWAGAVTPTSVTVKARTADDADAVRLVVGRGTGLADPVRSDAVGATESDQHVVALSVDGLTPDTAYHYALEVDGDVDTDRIGRFRTFPVGPSSFTFAVGADSRTGSNGKVYDSVRETAPLFLLNMGDFFYGDVDRDEPDLYRRQYDANLRAPAQAALYATTPLAYIWGDHDYAGNNADRTAPGKPAAMSVYRQYFPHYELRGGGETPIFQAFTVGDVRVVLTDNRSQRTPAGDEPATMLGTEQRTWFFEELADADRYGLVVWVNADPWVDRPDPLADTWAGYARERRRIANEIARQEVDNLLMVSGDAHMLAFDDGTNTDYSDAGTAGFPLFHAAALDRKPSIKGGPYTGPVIDGTGQFGTVQVRDDGKRVRVTLTGRSYSDGVLFTKTFTRTRSQPEP